MSPHKIKTRSAEGVWRKDHRICDIREMLVMLLEEKCRQSKIKFDVQDLEHQALFRYTTGIGIKEAIDEQFGLIVERMKAAMVKPEDLFCFGWKREGDWQMEWGFGRQKLYAIRWSKGLRKRELERKEIIFSEIKDKEMKETCSAIIEDYHYIHCPRCDEDRGMAFGFFLADSKLPFAVEQVEPCDISRDYKKAILLLAGIEPGRCAELTRFYSVPNTPKNLIGILDKSVGKILQKKGYEYMMTSVMPAFAKTRASTIAGGINTPLYCKPLSIKFYKRADGKYQFCVSRNQDRGVEYIANKWKLPPVYGFIKALDNSALPFRGQVYEIYD